MIPKLIQRQGAQHLAEEEAQAASDTSTLSAPPQILELIPESVARENLVFPLRLDGPVVYVAAADASNILLRDKLSFILNKDIRLIQYPRTDIRRAIRRHYGETQTESVDSMLTEFTDTALYSAAPEDAEEVARRDEPRLRRKSPLRGLGGMLGGMPEIARAVGMPVAKPKKRSMDLDDDSDLAELQSSAARIHQPGEAITPDYGTHTMWYYTVEDGQRALMIHEDGRMEVIVGPKRVWAWRKRFEKMRHFVAHPGDFLIVRFRDGRQEHLIGPTDCWFDPRIHEAISRQEALQLAAKEAVIVYSRPTGVDTVSRRIVHGPTLFVPAPGEWLHTFAWHGSEGGSQGQRKVAKGLVFQKLWLMPDQMYHDVTDVRVADDAVLTIKLMMFFELLDIDRMLETTHDPIGDFINAATSDVVDFCGHRTFEEFKKNTGELNELATYRQLTVARRRMATHQ